MNDTSEKSTEDRDQTFRIISKMLDNPDEHGIYPTLEAFEAFDRYIKKVRVEAIGWMLAEACISLDNDRDIRKENVPGILERALEDLMPKEF